MFKRKSKKRILNIERKNINHARTKFELLSKIKARLKNKKATNEIAKDLEKIKLEPGELILIELIETTISKPKRSSEKNYKKKLRIE